MSDVLSGSGRLFENEPLALSKDLR